MQQFCRIVNYPKASVIIALFEIVSNLTMPFKSFLQAVVYYLLKIF